MQTEAWSFRLPLGPRPTMTPCSQFARPYSYGGTPASGFIVGLA